MQDHFAPGALVNRVSPPAMLAGLGGTPGILAQLLARDPAAFGGGVGPAFPLGSLPLDQLDPTTGRPDPRKWQYEVAWNLDLQQRLAQWNILSSAAVQIDIFARAIAIRTSDVTKMDWSWNVSKDAINKIMTDNHVTSSEAAKTARETFTPQIVAMSELWENPYPQQDRAWEEFISEALWQLMVYDGWAVHPRYNLGGQCIGFDTIDASTIKCLLDNEGGPPEPPNPAYQQILWGFPRGEFLASPLKGTTLYLGGEYKISDRDQLSYYVINRRTNSPYGISPVEMALQIGNVYVERLKWLMAEYTYGSTARGYMETDTTEMTEVSFGDWNRILNQWFSGQTSTRQLLTALPKGFKAPIFTPQITEKFKADFDEMLIKRTAGHFGVQPSQFGVVARAGLGGGKSAAEGEQDMTETVSSKPQNKRVEGFINSLSRRYLGVDRNIVFELQDDEGSEDEVENATALQKYYSFGALVLNEVRRELGRPEFEFPEADMPMVITATGAVPIQQIGATNVGPGGAPAPGAGAGHSEEQPEEEGASEGAGGAQGGEARPGEGKATPPGVDDKSAQLDELRDFSAFVKARMKRGNWRAFEFATFDDATAEALNERGYFVAKGATPTPENLFAYFSAEVGRLASGETPKSSKSRNHNVEHVIRIAADHHGAIAAGLAGATGVAAAVSAALGGATVHGAVTSNVRFPSSTLQTSLEGLYQDAAAAGGAVAADHFGVDAVTGGARLQALLAQVPASIKGMEDTTLDRVMTQVQAGVNAGESAAQIGDRIQSTVFGPMIDGQATNIAMTEANRAYGASYLDTATAAGVTEINWVRGGDSDCPTCQDNEDNSPYPIANVPDFPAHPNCLCTFESVIP
jgi:hypothetical protein